MREENKRAPRGDGEGRAVRARETQSFRVSTGLRLVRSKHLLRNLTRSYIMRERPRERARTAAAEIYPRAGQSCEAASKCSPVSSSSARPGNLPLEKYYDVCDIQTNVVKLSQQHRPKASMSGVVGDADGAGARSERGSTLDKRSSAMHVDSRGLIRGVKGLELGTVGYSRNSE